MIRSILYTILRMTSYNSLLYTVEESHVSVSVRHASTMMLYIEFFILLNIAEICGNIKLYRREQLESVSRNIKTTDS